MREIIAFAHLNLLIISAILRLIIITFVLYPFSLPQYQLPCLRGKVYDRDAAACLISYFSFISRKADPLYRMFFRFVNKATTPVVPGKMLYSI